MNNNMKLVGDSSSLGVVIATILGYLPEVAALASLIYTGLQIYDWYKKRKAK